MLNVLTKSLVAFGLLFSTVAKAEHNEHGGLLSSTETLNYEVQYSYLNYRVKSAVSHFTNVVRNNAWCLNGSGDGIALQSFGAQPEGYQQLDHNDHGSCYYAVQQVRSAWYQVDRYLYDTYYDFPQVYYAYTEVREALQYLGY